MTCSLLHTWNGGWRVSSQYRLLPAPQALPELGPDLSGIRQAGFICSPSSEARWPGCLESLAGRGPESPSNISTNEEGYKGGRKVFAQLGLWNRGLSPMGYKSLRQCTERELSGLRGFLGRVNGRRPCSASRVTCASGSPRPPA